MKTRMSMLVALLCASAVALTGCVAAPGDSASSGVEAGVELLAQHSLTGLDAREVIDRLDAMPVAERPADLFASIKPDALLVSDGGGREVTLPLPKDEFYVSVAPYATQTHDCFFHSLTTCLGELQDESVHVTVTDADGTVLIDDTRRTFSNGFLGLWLPRDLEATITLEHEGKSVTAPLSTSDSDPTCVTTLQLT